MQKRTRQALLIGAATVFAVVTPLLVLYALGYRITSPRIGVLLIESTPTRAAVAVNGETVGTTPQTITNVDRETVEISLAKAGYLPWHKRLPLVRGGATEVRSVRLFPEKLLTRLVAESVQLFSLSPNRAFLAVLDSRQQLTILDESGAVISPPQTLKFLPQQLLWSPDNTQVVIGNQAGNYLLLTVAASQLRPLALPDRIIHSSLTWDPRLPGRLLMLNASSDLIAFDVTGQTSVVLTPNVAAFAPSERNILVATRAQTLITLDSLGRPIGTPLLLPHPIERLVVTPAGSAALIFDNGQAATIDEVSALQPLANSVQSLGFSPSGYLLYVQTAPHELMAYNLADEQIQYLPRHRLRLITRVSEAITHPQWFAGGEHIIYQIADRILITEIDTRDHAITTEIDSTNLSDSALAVGRDGDSLFYLKRTGDKIDLIRTSLVAE